MKIDRLSFLCLVAGAATLVSGCSSLGVKPWQRDVLAREEMRLDANPLDGAIDDHMYFSKEASPPEAVPLPVEAADAIETEGAAGPTYEYATALDGRKLCLAERRCCAKPGTGRRSRR